MDEKPDEKPKEVEEILRFLRRHPESTVSRSIFRRVLGRAPASYEVSKEFLEADVLPRLRQVESDRLEEFHTLIL